MILALALDGDLSLREAFGWGMAKAIRETAYVEDSCIEDDM